MKKEKTFLLIEGAEFAWADGSLGENATCICLKSPSVFRTNEGDGHSYIALVKLLEDHVWKFSGKKNITFVYYVTTEPKTLEECQENLACTVLGLPSATWHHAYSDLTGYLWTEVSIKANEKETGKAHDINEELGTHLNQSKVPLYLTLEIREH